MYYRDQIRRYNFATGLALGAVLGAGLALALKPQQRGRSGPAERLRGARDLLTDRLQAGRARIAG